MTRRLRVAFVTSRLSVGGAEGQVVDLANGLHPLGFDTFVVCTKDPGELAGRLDRPDSLTALESGGRDPRVVLRLSKTLRTLRPDVVHCTNFNSTAWGRAAARRAGVPVIVTAEHGAQRFSRKERLLIPMFNRLLDPVTAAVVACSRAQLPLLEAEGNSPDKLVVIPNGVRLPVPRKRTGGGGIVVSIVASLWPWKDHALFVEMASRVSRARDDVSFQIVGDGPCRADLEEQARAAGIEERVRFLGRRHDVPALLDGSDVVCLTSVSEALPLSLMEAMAHARPVVATDVGGVSEIVRDGVDGLLVPSGDADALTEAVLDLVRDPARREAYGEAAASRVAEMFALDVMLARYAALFESLARAGLDEGACRAGGSNGEAEAV